MAFTTGALLVLTSRSSLMRTMRVGASTDESYSFRRPQIAPLAIHMFRVGLLSTRGRAPPATCSKGMELRTTDAPNGRTAHASFLPAAPKLRGRRRLSYALLQPTPLPSSSLGDRSSLAKGLSNNQVRSAIGRHPDATSRE